MKKFKLFAATAVMAVCVALPKNAEAQKFQGQIVPFGAAGYSVAGIIFTAISDGLNAVDVKSSKTPVIIGGLDYGVSDRFSIGAVYTYQGLTAKYNSYYADTSNVLITGDFKDVLSRQSIGLRPLFHFGDNDDLDVYGGARFSYVWWNYSSSRTDVDWTNIFEGFGSPIKFQAVFGARYFFSEPVGIGMEFAFGPTYYMNIGIHARFGGN